MNVKEMQFISSPLCELGAPNSLPELLVSDLMLPFRLYFGFAKLCVSYFITRRLAFSRHV